MKKLSALFLSCILALSCLHLPARAAYLPDVDTLLASAREVQDFSFGEELFFNVCISYEGDAVYIFTTVTDSSITGLHIMINDQRCGTVPPSATYIRIPVTELNTAGPNSLMILTETTVQGESRLSLRDLGSVSCRGGVWQLDTPPEAIVARNLDILSRLPAPQDALEVSSARCAQLAADIVGNEADPYQRIQLIHDWICSNLYYDYLAYYGLAERITDVEGVLDTRHTVCAGFSALGEQLMRAAGIPCVEVSGYAHYTLGSSGQPFAVEGVPGLDPGAYYAESHAWNAIYVDGCWQFIDLTWDCGNKYRMEGGTPTYEDGPITSAYLNMDPVAFSRSHIARTTFGTLLPAETVSTPSSWALSEVSQAADIGLIPDFLLDRYQEGITRAEFATLAVAAIRQDCGSVSMLFKMGEYSYCAPDVFSDTNNPDVLLAYSLGIVNGRGGGIFDPDSLITRQEAATMLRRTAAILRPETLDYAKSNTFSDRAEFDSWALEGIDYVSSITASYSGSPIMGGMGNNIFSPRTNYTREQAFLTMLRLARATCPAYGK